MTRLHFSMNTRRDAVCPICCQHLVAAAMVFIDGHAFCSPCADLTDGLGRRYAHMVVAKHRTHRDGENWSTAIGLTFYTPFLTVGRRPYMLIDPDAAYIDTSHLDVQA